MHNNVDYRPTTMQGRF